MSKARLKLRRVAQKPLLAACLLLLAAGGVAAFASNQLLAPKTTIPAQKPPHLTLATLSGTSNDTKTDQATASQTAPGASSNQPPSVSQSSSTPTIPAGTPQPVTSSPPTTAIPLYPEMPFIYRFCKWPQILEVHNRCDPCRYWMSEQLIYACLLPEDPIQ